MSGIPQRHYCYHLGFSPSYLFAVCVLSAKQISPASHTHTFVLQCPLTQINSTPNALTGGHTLSTTSVRVRFKLIALVKGAAGWGHQRRREEKKKREEYKYVEWKLRGAPPSCVHCSYGTVDYKPKKVVLLCIHVHFFLFFFNVLIVLLIWSPFNNSMLELVSVSFTCCALMHLLMPHKYTTDKNPHAKKVCH